MPGAGRPSSAEERRLLTANGAFMLDEEVVTELRRARREL